jgi:Ran GTPase-activating protein (RanGAP) involved in mRNA processing and transport
MDQTAVEWLAEQMLYINNEYNMKLICRNQYQSKRRDIIEQSKEIFKQQIMQSLNDGKRMGIRIIKNNSFEDYYNENFKQQVQ